MDNGCSVFPAAQPNNLYSLLYLLELKNLSRETDYILVQTAGLQHEHALLLIFSSLKSVLMTHMGHGWRQSVGETDVEEFNISDNFN